MPLPVITACGGISPAGRTSDHNAFSRLVFEALDGAGKRRVLDSLAALTGTAEGNEALLEGTLIRRLEGNLFEAGVLAAHLNATAASPLEVEVRDMDLPDEIPEGWEVRQLDNRRKRLAIRAGAPLLLPSRRPGRVQSAGQLPGGFDPAALYPSRNHPRALQLAVYGASDALGSLGLDWDSLHARLACDEIAVYASNGMGQLDDAGFGGMMNFPARGKRTSSKQCPLGFGGMSADFINAYVLGTAGATGGMLGACATFLYNLQKGVQDIRSGRRRLVMVGTAEAPLVPEVIEGYRAMGALGEDEALLKLDPHRDTPDYRRACRPFGYNCGFTIAESAQFIILMDDELALETGADILGAVPDVFVHADGPKKSISAPGIGNYLTLGRAAALARQLVGVKGLAEHSFVHAHGTGTPQNRVTESHVLNETARAFNIPEWPVAAIKCYLGHSIGSAGGDQLAAALGTFATGLLPGIFTLDEVARDVHDEQLSFSREHRHLDAPMAALLNSKGFGGNNATAVVLSPEKSLEMIARRHGDKSVTQWRKKVETTRETVAQREQQVLAGLEKPRYLFGEGVLDGEDMEVRDDAIRLDGWEREVRLRHDPDFDEYV